MSSAEELAVKGWANYHAVCRVHNEGTHTGLWFNECESPVCKAATAEMRALVSFHSASREDGLAGRMSPDEPIERATGAGSHPAQSGGVALPEAEAGPSSLDERGTES